MRPTLLVAFSMSIGSIGAAQSEPIARLHYEGGHYEDALEIVRRELREDPTRTSMKQVGAWCLIRLAEQGDGTAEGREALRWFDDIRAAGKSNDVCELGVARVSRLLAERTEAGAERTRLLERAWTAASGLETLDRPAGVERVRVLVLLARLDDAEQALAEFVETCRRLRKRQVETRDSTPIEVLRRGAVAQIESVDVEVATVTMVWVDAMSPKLDPETSRRIADDLADRSAAVFRSQRVGRFLLDVVPDDPRIAPGCVLILRESPDSALRVDAARALGRLDGTRELAMPALVHARDDPSAPVVAEAVTSLGLRGDLTANALRAIEDLREHEDAGVRHRVEAVLRRPQSSSR